MALSVHAGSAMPTCVAGICFVFHCDALVCLSLKRPVGGDVQLSGVGCLEANEDYSKPNKPPQITLLYTDR